ncbi:MAG: hypothetical protein R3C58_12945 [Parvularculaceae bacterium]
MDIPLSDQLKTRHTIYYNTEHGYTDRIIAGDRLGDEEVIAGRSLVEWTPTENFNALLSFDISHRDGSSANTALLRYDPTSGLAPLWQGIVGDPMMIAAPAIENGDDPFNSSATGPNVDDHDIWGLNGRSTGISAVALKSITAYRSLDAEFGRDGDNSPVQYIQTHNFVDQNQFSQELQLSGEAMNGGLNWLIGGYYFDETPSMKTTCGSLQACSTRSRDCQAPSSTLAARRARPAPISASIQPSYAQAAWAIQ